jgi:hypothetical protein
MDYAVALDRSQFNRILRSMSPAVPFVTMLLAGGSPGAISTLRELGPALAACFHAPELSTGSEITIRFSLTKQGAVFGKPKITFSRLIGTPHAQEAFVAAAFAALSSCTPVAVTPELGSAIAGRPLSIHFIGGRQAISV